MRTWWALVLVAGSAMAAKTTKSRKIPQHLWEQTHRRSQAATPISLNIKDAQSNVDNLVAGKVSFTDLMGALVTHAMDNPVTGSLDPDNIDAIYQTFGFMQETPGYKDVADWSTASADDKKSALGKSLSQMVNLLGGIQTAMSGQGENGLDGMVADFMASGDETVEQLKKNIQDGVDAKSATEELQQLFTDKYMPGVTLSKLKDDNVIINGQKSFKENADLDILGLIGDDHVVKQLMNENLRFSTFDNLAKEAQL